MAIATPVVNVIVGGAEHAERLGYHHLTGSDLATFGYLAERTNGIRLATSVPVLGYHHPLEIVKRFVTLDQVSDERVGVGSQSVADSRPGEHSREVKL